MVRLGRPGRGGGAVEKLKRAPGADVTPVRREGIKKMMIAFEGNKWLFISVRKKHKNADE